MTRFAGFFVLIAFATASPALADRWHVAQSAPEAPAAASPTPAPYVLPEPADKTAPAAEDAMPPDAAAPTPEQSADKKTSDEKKGPIKRAVDAVKGLIGQKPAKELFSHTKLPSLGEAMSYGYYPRGCLQGGVELPINGRPGR